MVRSFSSDPNLIALAELFGDKDNSNDRVRWQERQDNSLGEKNNWPGQQSYLACHLFKLRYFLLHGSNLFFLVLNHSGYSWHYIYWLVNIMPVRSFESLFFLLPTEVMWSYFKLEWFSTECRETKASQSALSDWLICSTHLGCTLTRVCLFALFLGIFFSSMLTLFNK